MALLVLSLTAEFVWKLLCMALCRRLAALYCANCGKNYVMDRDDWVIFTGRAEVTNFQRRRVGLFSRDCVMGRELNYYSNCSDGHREGSSLH